MLNQVNEQSKCARSGDCVKPCKSAPVTGWKINGGYMMSGPVDHNTEKPESRSNVHSHMILSVRRRGGSFQSKMKPNRNHFGGHHHGDGHNH